MNIRKQLRHLRTIQPRNEYMQWSRAVILGAPRHSPFAAFLYRMQLSIAMALAGFLLLILFGGITFFLPSPRERAYIDFQRLVAEAEELNIEMKLVELQAYSANKDAMAAALKEAAETSPGQLSVALLEKEQQSATKVTPHIERLDNEITGGLNALIQ